MGQGDHRVTRTLRANIRHTRGIKNPPESRGQGDHRVTRMLRANTRHSRGIRNPPESRIEA